VQAEKVHNQDLYFKKAVKHVGEPMSHLESIASSAVPLITVLWFFHQRSSVSLFKGLCTCSVAVIHIDK